MLQIYAFCNLGYGAPCIRMLEALVAEHRDIRCTLVLSCSSQGTGLRSLFRRAGTWWQSRHAARSLSVRLVADINDRKFIDSVAQGAIGVVCGFNQIFRQDCISRFGLLVNCHPSILPYYRGAIPSYWAIRRGETVSGFTLHKITPRIDSGEILFQEYVQISSGDNESTLDNRISQAGAEVLRKLILGFRDGEPFERRILDSPYINALAYVPKDRS